MTFDEFVGNSGVVESLRAAIAAGRLPHSLILLGPRGAGKFTLALMLTMALECERQPREAVDGRELAGFCGECRNCTRIAEGAELEAQLLASASPAVIEPDAKPVQLGLDAFEQALGVRPVLIRSGGTLPVASALAQKGIATIITGFSLPDANIHSPNERLLAEYVDLGTAATRALFAHLASI